MRLPIRLFLPLIAIGLATGAPAQQAERVGVAAPLSDAQAILGEQVVAGVRAGLDGAASVATEDTGCSARGGRRAADRFVAADMRIVIGFLCTEALDAAAPVLAEAGIPILDVGVRARSADTDEGANEPTVWRLAPDAEAEARAVAGFIEREWRDRPFGLIEDGSLGARDLISAIERRLGENGLQAQTIDNYRPAEDRQFGLVRRLERTGVTHFFIAGDRPDVAIVARDAAAAGLSFTIVGGEDLLDEAGSDTALPEGTRAIAPRYDFSDWASGDAKATAFGYFGPGFVAGQIAAAALADGAGDRDLSAVLAQTRFTTALGPVVFDETGRADLDWFTLQEWTGETFAPAVDTASDASGAPADG